jgi:hypothetical protein
MNDFRIQCARLCNIQYKKKEDLDIHIVRENDVDTPIIAIKGSNKLKCWLRNLECAPNRHGVHTGMWKYTIWCIKKYDLLSVFNRYKHITITGHSSGAATAMLICYMMQKRNLSFRLIMFGCPKIGTAKFCYNFQKIVLSECVSFSTGKDIFTCLPICLYRHPVSITFVNSNFGCLSFKSHGIDAYITDRNTTT